MLCTLFVGQAAAMGWPLRRTPKASRTRQLEEEEFERQRERLSTYETALQYQHRRLMELRIRNRELERICANLLNVIIFSIVWPRVARLINARASRRARLGAARRTTFADVAGCAEAKQELAEVVEFLKHPKKFKQAGARVPKGVIMEGGPGVGKTMLARAVAGEAGVNFIDTSGSALGSTIYVGVGASKVRALFAEARRKRPCIVFIDEIDAIGGKRESSGSGGSQEAARTLNQLLTEMDGFAGDTGVVVMAATNRADVLDSALLRAGRFDRRVPISAPNVDERAEILKVRAAGGGQQGGG
jgi:ATP-dependent Zn protease